MNIIFSCDNNYAPYLATTISSVLNNNKKQKIKFYILDLGIQESSRQIIQLLVNKFNCQIEFINISANDFVNLPKTIDYISIATYARLKLAQYITDIKRAIYLDVDTLVNDNLLPLWETDLQDKWVGACFDAFIEYDCPMYKQTIGLNDEQKYFNAGVLLIDLEKWRTADIYGDAIQWLRQYQDIIQYQDQDILNGLFKDKVLYLNTRFNFMPTQRERLKRSKTNSKIMPNDFEIPVMPIAIYHYCGPHKAWHRECTHMKASLYLKFFRKIPATPASWNNSFEHVDLRKKLSRLKQDLKDKYKHNIY